MDLPFPAYRGSDNFVFVSYAHKDDEEVYRDLIWLHDNGIKIWYDEGIRAGSSWRDEIAKAIEACTLFLYYVSPFSLRSEHCAREISYALDLEKAVLPVFLCPAELPPGLKLSLGHKQAIERHRYQESVFLAKLLEATLGGAIEDDLPAAAIVRNYALPDRKIAIALLPFRHLGSNEEHEFLAEGISQDCTTMLCRISGLYVISRNSTHMYKDRAVNYREIGSQLGVGLLVDGTLRISGTKLRLSVQLVDTSSEATVWAARIDSQIDDIFDLQDELTEAIVTQLLPNIQIAEALRVDEVRMDAWSHFKKGWAAWNYNYTKTSSEIAISHMKNAIAADPNYADPYAALGVIYANRVSVGWSPDLSEMVQASEYAEKSLALAPNNPLALYAIAVYGNVTGDRKGALSQIERAIQLEPCNSNYLALAGVLTAAEKETEKGIELCERALRLSPQDPRIHMLYFNLSLAFFWSGRFEEMLDALNLSVRVRESDNAYAAFGLVFANLNLDRIEEARKCLDRAMANSSIDPRLVIATLLNEENIIDENKKAIALRSKNRFEALLN
ncbi:MAG: TolB-like protein/Flp pilus assembly protein TadD [Candidatus Pseudothioglobus sp.]|jgi:TolB-like protein/Flp pilus assembly protein TadD